MNHTEFVQKVVDVFAQKKRSKEIIQGRVYRGRAPSSSADLENLLARYISEIICHGHLVLVDYPVTYDRTNGKCRTVYPDILILKNNVLMGIVEFKIDLGYLDGNWIEKNDQMISDIKSSGSICYNKNTGVGPADKQFVEVPQSIEHCVAVLTAGNDHGKLPDFKKKTQCFVLCNGPHPNDPIIQQDELVEKIVAAGNNDWNSFCSFLRKSFC